MTSSIAPRPVYSWNDLLQQTASLLNDINQTPYGAEAPCIHLDGKHYKIIGVRICDGRIELEHDHAPMREVEQ